VRAMRQIMRKASTRSEIISSVPISGGALRRRGEVATPGLSLLRVAGEGGRSPLGKRAGGGRVRIGTPPVPGFAEFFCSRLATLPSASRMGRIGGPAISVTASYGSAQLDLDVRGLTIGTVNETRIRPSQAGSSRVGVPANWEAP
jgi:hypothetical protein